MGLINQVGMNSSNLRNAIRYNMHWSINLKQTAFYHGSLEGKSKQLNFMLKTCLILANYMKSN